jgi:hypothetical protein
MNRNAAAAMLLSQMECPASMEAEFHDWYDHEHIPERMAVPGFQSTMRYEVEGDGPRYLARYDLEDLSALEHPDYVKVKANPSKRTEKILSSVSLFTRYVATVFSDRRQDGAPERPEEAPYILIAAFAVPREEEKDFDAWYEEEHTDLLMKAEGGLGGSRALDRHRRPRGRRPRHPRIPRAAGIPKDAVGPAHAKPALVPGGRDDRLPEVRRFRFPGGIKDEQGRGAFQALARPPGCGSQPTRAWPAKGFRGVPNPWGGFHTPGRSSQLRVEVQGGGFFRKPLRQSLSCCSEIL